VKRELLRAVVSTSTLLACLAVPNHGQASSVGLTGGDTGPVIRWPTADLDYQLHAACSDDLPPAACLDALRASFDAWVGFICSPIAFTEGATTSTKNLTAIGGGTNGQNELAFIEDSAWTYGKFVLGVTAPVFLGNGTIIESDIAFNGYLQTWSLDGADYSTDVINVAVHEVGHYFGAQHNLGGYDPADPPTMAPYADPFMGSRTPESDDIRTLCFLYPTATYVCASDADCPFIVDDGPDGEFYAGQFTCDNNSCSDVSATVIGGTGALGDACVGTVDCSPGLYCVFTNGTSGVCSQDCTVSLDDCPAGFSCIPVSSGADEGVCLIDTGGSIPEGENCSAGTDCISGLCVIEPGGQFCRQPCNDDADCTTPEVCQPLGGGATVGACYPPAPGGTAPFGDPCNYGVDCASGLCVSDGSGGALCTDPCQDDADCPSLYSCLPLFGGGAACIEDPPPTGELGDPCTVNNDCISNLCAGEPTAGFFCVTPCTTDPDCGPGFFCAPLQGGGGACIELGDGEPLDPCQFTNDCQSNLCISVNNGNPFCTITCAATSDCPCGMQCFAFDPDPLCIPAPPVQCLPNGDPCTDDSECVGLFCINGTCESGCATYNGCLVCDGFVGDGDSDGDGVPDACDNCLTVGNASQVDSDNDGAGDGCDICPLGADGQDADGDGVPDACETCFTEPPDPNACDDGNACTDDTCEPTGCVNSPNTSTCDDGDACTENDACGGGACAGTPLDCSDGNACTDDVCTGGVCSNPNNTAACDDGDPCTGNDTCAGGSCVGQPDQCGDNNPCTDDSCVGGNCQFDFNTDGCDDGDACTVGDVCTNGVCLPTGPLDCSDGDDCTDDFCVSGTCTNPNNLGPCDDGDACTENDTCFGGSCSGNAISCDDGNDCTADSCTGAGACVSTPNTAPCDDGDACTDNDACLASSCVGTALDCDDGVACTVDSCVNGNCFNVDPNCDDGDPCTLDLCDTNGCSNPPNTGPCDDGDACTDNDSCATGSCVGSPLACDDGNPCTTDSCVGGACTSTNASGACDDGNGCTANDTCSAGNCLGTPVDCNDDNPCTDDSCVAGACQNTANTSTCDDGDPCTSGDVCGAGACAGAPLVCDDGNPCTSATCVAGACVFTDVCPDTAPDAAPDAVSDGSTAGDGGAVLPPDGGPDAGDADGEVVDGDALPSDAGGGDAQLPDTGLDGASGGDATVADVDADGAAGDGSTLDAAVDIDAEADTSTPPDPQPEPAPEPAPEPVADAGVPDVSGGGDLGFDTQIEAQVEFQETLGSGGCDCQSGEDSPAGPLGTGLVLAWLLLNVLRRRR